jgi:ubiquinone/menaquinone biosynthesis C-methylase UbiE
VNAYTKINEDTHKMENENSLRATFNKAANDYDAVRPGYPQQLFTDVIAFSAISPGGQVLEIGCGPGKATLPFACYGCSILCLDIGPDLLALAAQNLSSFPNVRFANISFEEWPLQENTYQLVYAATSFHWIPREIGYPKAVQALVPGGALAVFSNTHPRPFTGFFAEVQPIYNLYLPGLGAQRERIPTVAEIEAEAAWMRSTQLFSCVEVCTYPWTKTYSTAEYIRLLNTYSNHLALPEEQRRALYHAIADLIDTRFAGKVEKPYLTELFLGRKPADP